MLELPSTHAPRLHDLLSLSTDNIGYASRWLQESAGLDLPTVEQLGRLLNLAFFTSLQPEEGRPVRFWMCWVPSTSAPGAQRLMPSVPATVESLAKLGPATEPGLSGLLVRHKNRGATEFEVWGIVQLPSPPDFVDAREYPGYQCPEFLYVKIVGPGAIELWLYSEPVFTYVRGHGVIHDDRTLGEKEIHKRIPGFRPHGDDYLEIRDVVPMVRTMRAHRNGGALIVVPGADAAQSVAMKYAVRDRGVLRDSGHRAMRGVQPSADPRNHVHVPTVLAQSTHRQALRTIGRLTAVDGATVITWCGELLGFGGKITVPEGISDTEVLHIDPRTRAETRRPLKEVVGGMRHTSAVAACQLGRQGTTAFVASQDGDLTIVGWHDDELLVVRPIGSF